MPRFLTDLRIEKDETKEWTSAEGVHFAITNRSAGWKKVRLAFTYARGRKKKGQPMASPLPDDKPV